MIFKFSFDDNGTFHNDLVLELEHFERHCDSFYLVNDNLLLPEQTDADKVRAVLVRLLQQWSDAVRVLAPGDQTYLPYLFDDQASSWLRVHLTDTDTVELLPVWSTLEGWAFSPSVYAEALGRIGTTTPVWKELLPQVATRGEVLESIAGSISNAQSGTRRYRVRTSKGRVRKSAKSRSSFWSYGSEIETAGTATRTTTRAFRFDVLSRLRTSFPTNLRLRRTPSRWAN
jgi:hypothetical protein